MLSVDVAPKGVFSWLHQLADSHSLRVTFSRLLSWEHEHPHKWGRFVRVEQ